MTGKSGFWGGFPWIDRRDFVFIAGASLLGAGFWWIYPPAGLIVPGAILCGVAVFGVRG